MSYGRNTYLSILRRELFPQEGLSLGFGRLKSLPIPGFHPLLSPSQSITSVLSGLGPAQDRSSVVWCLGRVPQAMLLGRYRNISKCSYTK